MGDTRFTTYLERIEDATDPVVALRALPDDGVIQALAAAARDRRDPYLANVLATEAMNRMSRSRTIAQHMGDGVYALDRHGRVTFMNPAAERLLGWSREDLAAERVHDVVHVHGPGTTKTACSTLEPVTAGTVVTCDEVAFRRRDGSTFFASVVSAPVVRADTVEGTVITFRDVTERKRAEHLLEGQTRLLQRMVATGWSLSDVLDELARFIESQTDGLHASFLLVDAEGERLVHGAAPSLAAGLADRLNGVVIASRIGPCARAVEDAAPVHVVDLHADGTWSAFRELTDPFGYRALWSTPVVGSDDRVLGTFALYHDTPTAPTAFHERLIGVATQLARLAIERARDEAGVVPHESSPRTGTRVAKR